METSTTKMPIHHYINEKAQDILCDLLYTDYSVETTHHGIYLTVWGMNTDALDKQAQENVQSLLENNKNASFAEITAKYGDYINDGIQHGLIFKYDCDEERFAFKTGTSRLLTL